MLSKTPLPIGSVLNHRHYQTYSKDSPEKFTLASSHCVNDFKAITKCGVGIAERQGVRDDQEDNFSVSTLKPSNRFFFSGLSGQQTDEQKKEQEKFSRLVLSNFAASMQKVCRDKKTTCGSTAMTVLDQRVGNKIRVAASYLGDTSAYLVVINKNTGQFRSKRLNSHLHNPDPHHEDSKDEYKRVNESSFLPPFRYCDFPKTEDTCDLWRIASGLALSRAYGDEGTDKFGLNRRPEIEFHEEELKEEEEAYVVLVCDGVGEVTHCHSDPITPPPSILHPSTEIAWGKYCTEPQWKSNVIPTAKQISERDLGIFIAVGVIHKLPLENVAEMIVDAAMGSGSGDNCTAVIGKVTANASKKDLYDGHGGKEIADTLAKEGDLFFEKEVDTFLNRLNSEKLLVKHFNAETGCLETYELPAKEWVSRLPEDNNDAKISAFLKEAKAFDVLAKEKIAVSALQSLSHVAPTAAVASLRIEVPVEEKAILQMSAS